MTMKTRQLKPMKCSKSSSKRELVQFSHSVLSDSLWPHESQHARPPCPSPTHGVYSNSCPLSQWCHPTTSSCVIPFPCLQSFPASGSIQMSQLFTSGSQSTGVSTLASVHPKGNQSWLFTERTDVETETLIIWPPDAKQWLIGKDPDAKKAWRWEEKGTIEDEMAGWHHWLNGHEFG